MLKLKDSNIRENPERLSNSARRFFRKHSTNSNGANRAHSCERTLIIGKRVDNDWNLDGSQQLEEVKRNLAVTGVAKVVFAKRSKSTSGKAPKCAVRKFISRKRKAACTSQC